MELHAHSLNCTKIIYDSDKMQQTEGGLFSYILDNTRGDRYYYHKDSRLSIEGAENGEYFFVYKCNLPKLLYLSEFSDWHTWGVNFIFKEKIHVEQSVGLNSLLELRDDELVSYLNEIGKSAPLMIVNSNSGSHQCIQIMARLGSGMCPKLSSMQNMFKDKTVGSGLELLDTVAFSNDDSKGGKYFEELPFGSKLCSYPIFSFVDDVYDLYPQVKGELIDYHVILTESERNLLQSFIDPYPAGKNPKDFGAAMIDIPKFSNKLFCLYLLGSDIEWIRQ